MSVKLSNLNPGYLYFLSYDDNSVFYIGLTGNPQSRYKTHRAKNKVNITMTVFDELKFGECDAIESYVIREAIINGFELKNSETTLVGGPKNEFSILAYDYFKQGIGNQELEIFDGIKILPHIDKTILEKKNPDFFKIQIILPYEKGVILQNIAKSKGIDTSDLAYAYVLERL